MGVILSDLNLIPNPPLIVGQAAIFLINMVIVKKLMIDPYLALREQRMRATEGQSSEALRLENQAIAFQKEIDEKLRKAVQEGWDHVADRKKHASAAFSARVAAAKKDAANYVGDLRQHVHQQLAEEESKVADYVKRFADEVYATVLH